MGFKEGFFAELQTFYPSFYEALFDLFIEVSGWELDVVIEVLPVAFDGYRGFAKGDDENNYEENKYNNDFHIVHF